MCFGSRPDSSRCPQAYSADPAAHPGFDADCKEEHLTDADFEAAIGLSRVRLGRSVVWVLLFACLLIYPRDVGVQEAFKRKPNWTRDKLLAKAGLI